MSIYPPEVERTLESRQRSGTVESENAGGMDASFICGSFVRFSIRIDSEAKKVAAAGFQTNGCGFMTAAADILAGFVEGRALADLHGLREADLSGVISEELGIFEEGRLQCSNCCIHAIRTAFADYRARQIEEFRGETALICTCFGITEDRIEQQIAEKSLTTVEDVTNACNAGGGCGSCRMLIQEIIDSRADGRGTFSPGYPYG